MPFSAPIAPTRTIPPRCRSVSVPPKWWAMSKCDMVLSRKVSLSNCRSCFRSCAGISGAGIGDDKADVEIVRSVGESPRSNPSCERSAVKRGTEHQTPFRRRVPVRQAMRLAWPRARRRPPTLRSAAANSLPIPDEAPVTSAQGPNRSLSRGCLHFCFLCCVLLRGDFPSRSSCNSFLHHLKLAIFPCCFVRLKASFWPFICAV